MIATDRRAPENFIVNLAGATTIPATGTLVDTSTGNVNLTEGQLGIVALSPFGSVAMNSFTDATPTITEAPVIGIVQGTPYSQSIATSSVTYPLWVRPFEQTRPIDGQSKNEIKVTKQAFVGAKHAVWSIGAISSATTGQVNVLDETEYALTIAWDSVRDDTQFSSFSSPAVHPSIVTPDFTTLSSTYPLPVDYILTQFAYNINRNAKGIGTIGNQVGRNPFFALLVGLANSGPSGAAAGTAISGLTAGSTLNVITVGSQTRAITLTQEMVDSIQAAGTATGFTYIFTTDLSQAGAATGGTATGMFIIGLDADQSYVDYIASKKINLTVGLTRGFNYSTVTSARVVAPLEGQGYGRTLSLLYAATQGQRKYFGRHTQDPVVNFPNPIVETQTYVVYNIHHGSWNSTAGRPEYSPYREIIAIPRYSTGTTTNPVIALFDTALNSWLASSNNANVTAL